MSFEEENDNFNLVMEDSAGDESTTTTTTATESVSDGIESATDARWLLVEEFKSKNELKDYLQAYTHKVTATHGQQKSKCNKHADGHVQTYGYLRCSSVKCIKTPGDCCSFVFKVSFGLVVISF